MSAHLKVGRVLVCVLVAGRVEVRGWVANYPDWVIDCVLEGCRREGRPTWIEKSGAPACLPDQRRGFTNYRTGEID